jgi:hypothetical protein
MIRCVMIDGRRTRAYAEYRSNPGYNLSGL